MKYRSPVSGKFVSTRHEFSAVCACLWSKNRKTSGWVYICPGHNPNAVNTPQHPAF